jgi:hypothetical protein
MIERAGLRPTVSQLRCLLSYVYSISAVTAHLLMERAAWFEAVGAFAYLAVDKALG